ncbi:hypothetical protein CR513_45685, partial [Mucuna pruriens]
VQDRVSSTSSRLSYSRPKPDWFLVSRDRIVESRSTLVSLRLSHFERLHAFDPEIERSFHRLRKIRHIVTLDSSSSDSIWNFENSNFTTDKSNFSDHQ